MRWLLLVVFLFAPAFAGELLKFSFVDSAGVQYRIGSLGEDFSKQFGFKFEPNVILIQAKSANNESLKTQIASLEKLGHNEIEKLNVVWVVSTIDSEYTSGYRTTLVDARRLAEGLSDFRVSLLSTNGEVLKLADKPVSGDVVRGWIKDFSNKK